MKLEDLLHTVYNYGTEYSLDEKDVLVNKELENLIKIPYIYNIFYGFLSECFVEGYYGDASLSSKYVNDLTEIIYDNLGSLKNLLNTKSIIDRLPKPVFDILVSRDNIYLAGGGALKVILNQSWDGDWDIYCSYPDAQYATSKLGGISNSSPNTYGGYNFGVNDFKIQIIPVEFENIIDVLSRFDITICQFAISKNIPCIYGTDDAFKDLHQQIFHVNPESFIKNSREQIKSRINKYLERGFMLSAESQRLLDKMPIKSHLPKLAKKKKLAPELNFAPANFALDGQVLPPTAITVDGQGFPPTAITEEDDYDDDQDTIDNGN